MRPIERRETGQNDLLRSRLYQIIDPAHALVRLAQAIDWRFLEEGLGAVYRDGVGRPPLPTRLMAGLAILEHMHELSDGERISLPVRPIDRRLKNRMISGSAARNSFNTGRRSTVPRSPAGGSAWARRN